MVKKTLQTAILATGLTLLTSNPLWAGATGSPFQQATKPQQTTQEIIQIPFCATKGQNAYEAFKNNPKVDPETDPKNQ